MLGAGVCVCVLVTQSCLTLCNIMDCISPDSSANGILQVRILEWVAIPFSRGSSQPRDRTRVSHIVSRFFTIWTVDPYKLLICVLISNQYSSTSDHGENYFNPATGVVGIMNKDSLCIWKEKLSLSSTFHLEKQFIRLGKVGTPLTLPLPGASCPRLTQRGHSSEWPHRGWRLMSKC